MRGADDPVVLALVLAGPVLLGLLLRGAGVVLGGVAVAGVAVALAVDRGDPERLGAAVLGAAGGLALGLAGALVRGALRRRRRTREIERGIRAQQEPRG